MPINDFGKFSKYSPPKKEIVYDAEKTASELVSHAEKLRMKNINLTLLADDFFRDSRGVVASSVMFTGAIIPPHNHDYFEINYVISGQCVEYIGNRAFILEEGDFLLMPPAVSHAPGPVGHSKCVNVLMKCDWISSIEKRLIAYDLNNFLTRIQKQNTYMVFKAKDKPAFETAKFMSNACSDKEKQHNYHDIYTESLALKMLIELSECNCTETFYTSPKPHIAGNVSEAILQYIKDNLSAADLESTADHFGYSPSHISRLIKKHTGNGFSTYIILQRILRAEYLLAKTDIPIGRIPAIIGLDSKEYFSRVFKKYNNVSPQQYRSMQK